MFNQWYTVLLWGFFYQDLFLIIFLREKEIFYHLDLTNQLGFMQINIPDYYCHFTFNTVHYRAAIPLFFPHIIYPLFLIVQTWEIHTSWVRECWLFIEEIGCFLSNNQTVFMNKSRGNKSRRAHSFEKCCNDWLLVHIWDPFLSRNSFSAVPLK